MSGLRFARYADTYVINTVVEESPAAEGGLKFRDFLSSVNGTPAQSITRQELDQYLRLGDGVGLDICVIRETQPLCATIRLRQMM